MLNIFLFFQKKFFYLFIFYKRPEKKPFHGEKKHPARPRSPDVNHIGLSTILLFSGAEK